MKEFKISRDIRSVIRFFKYLSSHHINLDIKTLYNQNNDFILISSNGWSAAYSDLELEGLLNLLTGITAIPNSDGGFCFKDINEEYKKIKV